METPEPGSAPAAKPTLEKYLTPIAVLIGAVLIAGALVYSGGGAGFGGPQGPHPIKADINDVTTEGSPFIGQADAPVTMAFFYDYQCPFCKQFEEQVTPELMTKYIESGKVKMVLKDFQFLGEDSVTAALFGRALWEAQPDKYYAWYVAMYKAQDDEGDEGFGDLASIKKLAAAIPGLDVARVSALMEQNEEAYQAAIEADRAEGAALGVNGTPSVIVGKQLFTGLTPDAFIKAISKEIDKQL